ncbi:MAG: ABC transporter ATP-binding protein [Actinomycetota bacterium]
MAEIGIEQVDKIYPDGTEAVTSVDLDIQDGTLMVLVGPSGCGKTTLLRMVAGLEDVSAGTIRIGDRVVNDVPPKDRDIAMVFQNYALYPHMSVFDNMAYGLKLKKMAKSDIKEKVVTTAATLGLNELLHKKPGQLSGGQRQRVAMGRAIVREPKAFLMDEPLSNLDAKLRVQMRAEISQIQSRIGVTTMYVTHDQTEAMTMGDRVAVMKKGLLQQVDSPQSLYDHPINLFVAGFIGSPAMNLVEADLRRSNGGYSVQFGGFDLGVDAETLRRHAALESYADRRVVVGMRPEDIEDAALAPGTPEDRRMPVTVGLREAMGAEVYAHFQIDAAPVVTEEIKEIAKDVGEEALGLLEAQAGENKTTFVARLGARTEAAVGQRIEVAIDTRNLHFFDPETGQGIY